MNDGFDTIIWSKDAENDLDDIENYYLEISPEKASEHIINIILKVAETVYSAQWQIDEYDSSCRRMIINKKFRVLYKVINEIILILSVYPTQKNPENILHN